MRLSICCLKDVFVFDNTSRSLKVTNTGWSWFEGNSSITDDLFKSIIIAGLTTPSNVGIPVNGGEPAGLTTFSDGMTDAANESKLDNASVDSSTVYN